MPGDMKWSDAINKILSESTTPLHYEEITTRIVEQGLKAILGATPSQSVSAKITSSIKHEGASSPYVRVAKGTFALSAAEKIPLVSIDKLTPDVSVSVEEEEQYQIVTSFGMYWRRSAVEWRASSKLLGVEHIGAVPVDFNQQLGIYLLYDGREVIYIGRTTDRPLGRRLYEHTLDRLAVRWDRFSWFGLLPITESGALEKLPLNYDSAKLIPVLEAILIEAVEPRQNRQRGQGLQGFEYYQLEDQSIEKKRMKDAFEMAMSKI